MNSTIQQKSNEEVSRLVKKIESILRSDLSPYERKIALFEVIKRLEVGTMSPEKKERTNWLLQGHLYNELAKQCMDEYKKTTVKAFSK